LITQPLSQQLHLKTVVRKPWSENGGGASEIRLSPVENGGKHPIISRVSTIQAGGAGFCNHQQ